MKRNRFAWAMPALALAAAVLLSACGATAPQTAAAEAVSPEFKSMAYTEEAMAMDMAAAPAEMPTADTGGGAKAALDDRKIVKHTRLSLETKEFDQALARIGGLIEGAGGYVESQSVDGQSLSDRGSYYERRASVTARVPSEKLDGLVSSVGGLCNIVSRSENMDDITDSYFDADARLSSLRQQEETLLDILSKAEKLEDVIQLQTALSDVRYQIESLTAQLRRMDSQVAYSYLNMDLREVGEYQQALTTPTTFGEKLSAAASRAGAHLLATAQGILLFLVEAGPVLLFWIVVLLAVLLVVRVCLRASKKRRERKRQAVIPGAADSAPGPDDSAPRQ